MVDGMLENKALKNLRSGRYAIGTIVGFIRNPSFMRILGANGYDFVFIDTTHASFSWETLGDMCDMARASGVVPIIRPYDRSGGIANRALDVGAMGLIYPHIERREEIASVLTWLKYEPEGDRGATGRGGASTDYTRSGSLSQTEVRKFINDNTLVTIQVESGEAVDNLDEILEGGGVDVVEVGRTDLSSSLGYPSDIRHPSVLNALDKVISTCRARGVAPGAGCYSQEDAEDMVRRGMRWLTYSSDRQLLHATYSEGFAMLSGLVRSVGASV